MNSASNACNKGSQTYNRQKPVGHGAFGFPLITMLYYGKESKMKKFRKKPVEIEAIQWTGNCLADTYDLAKSLGVPPEIPINNKGQVLIKTLEGTMAASKGDWIIRGIQGELYPCKPDIFEATYEPVI